MLWFKLGLMGWASMMFFRIVVDGHVAKHSFMSYVRGFMFALLLGPLTFGFLAFGIVAKIIIKRRLKNVIKNQG